MDNKTIFLIVVAIVLFCSPWFWGALAKMVRTIHVILFIFLLFFVCYEVDKTYNTNDIIACEPGTATAPQYLEPIVDSAAAKYNIGKDTILAIIQAESDFNKFAVSHAGAEGLMQLMPETGKRMGVTDPFDERQNIFGGTRYFSLMLNHFNSLDLALAAYYTGPEAVEKARGVPYIAEDYVWRVKSLIK
jgi:soluble lytic murein transglycosylase-like protein